ncbi:MAG TPA: cupredoxin family copper-binding protein [Longimicrobiaceae bacterium]|nr:cupredoxin family copper-binding protein [Longimicrobiaceae bacterium]
MRAWRSRSRAGLCALALAAGTPAGAAGAQSLLDRPPNLSGAWVGTSGTLYFNFMHRFTASASPERKVSNTPTFTVAAGLPSRTLLGVHYATNSVLAPRYPNEWEFFARHRLFSQDDGAPLDVAGQVGYNLAAEGVDGEVSLARRLGPLRVIGAARVMSDPFETGNTRFAAAGGATFRLGRWWAVAGDAATLLNREEGEEMAWSAGLHLAIPHTPHSLSVHASNTYTTTLQGISRGGERVRYGFEFTVPLTLRRWFGSGGGVAAVPPPTEAVPAAAATPSAEAPAAGGALVRAGMRGFAYTPARIEVAAGTTVEWKNEDPMAHTVTATDGGFDSGLIEPGATWRRTFDTPGTYPFSCTPHPFMKGTVVVRAP